MAIEFSAYNSKQNLLGRGKGAPPTSDNPVWPAHVQFTMTNQNIFFSPPRWEKMWHTLHCSLVSVNQSHAEAQLENSTFILIIFIKIKIFELMSSFHGLQISSDFLGNPPDVTSSVGSCCMHRSTGKDCSWGIPENTRKHPNSLPHIGQGKNSLHPFCKQSSKY